MLSDSDLDLFGVDEGGAEEGEDKSGFSEHGGSPFSWGRRG